MHQHRKKVCRVYQKAVFATSMGAENGSDNFYGQLKIVNRFLGGEAKKWLCFAKFAWNFQLVIP